MRSLFAVLLLLIVATNAFRPLPMKNAQEMKKGFKEALSRFSLPSFLEEKVKGRKEAREHLDETMVTVEEKEEEGREGEREDFLVVIDHLEGETSDDEIHSLLASRDIRVSLSFEVLPQGLVLLNSVPVPPGLSHLSVKAELFEMRNGEKVKLERIEEIRVRVWVGFEEHINEKGELETLLTLQERVVGVLSSHVWQASVFQHVFALYSNGSVKKLSVTEIEIMNEEPLQTEGNEGSGCSHNNGPHHANGHHGNHHQGNHHHGNHHHGNGHHGNAGAEEHSGLEEEVENHFKRCAEKFKEWLRKGKEWFHGLSFPMKVAVAFGGGLTVGVMIMAVMKCLKGCCRCLCSKKCKAQKKQDLYKSRMMTYSIQYTALPTDDLKKEKEKEKEEKEKDLVQMV